MIYIKPSRPFSNMMSFIVYSKKAIVSFIAALNIMRCPNAIVRRIRPIVIYSLKRISPRAFTHCFKESGEIVFPFLTHSNATATIAFIGRIFKIEATSLCSNPAKIFRRTFTTMIMTSYSISSNFSAKTSTAAAMSCRQMGSTNRDDISARALTYPCHNRTATINTVGCTPNYCQSLKNFICEISKRHKIFYAREILIASLLLSLVGCGIRAWSASTEATYEITKDGKKIFYESNKEMQGLILEVSEIEGRINTVKISVDKASTSEAAIAAALQMQLNLQTQLLRLIDQLTPLAAAAAKAGS